MSKFKLSNPDAPMSFKQGIMIRNLGGGDVREEGLTMQEASDRIEGLLAAKGKDASSEAPKVDYAELLERAQAAGLAAGKGITPVGMRVNQHANPMDDASPVVQSWDVPDGPCGFAWVNFKMKKGLGRKFGQWLIKQDSARKDSYYGGVTLWISDHGQSMARKEAHARAMAKVLQEAGIEDAYMMSRMD